MPPADTHYDVLKVSPDATAEQIQASYRDLCRIYHPDVMPGNAQAHEMMALINVSYEVLSDPARRREYDAELARHQAAITPQLAPEAAEPSRYFMPGDEAEEPKPTRRPFHRTRHDEQAEQADANREFLVHFGKRVLLVFLIIAFIVYTIVESRYDHTGGWLFMRALRHVFFSW